MALRSLRLSRAATLITIVVLAWPVALPLPLPNFDHGALPLPYLVPTISLAEVTALVAIASYALAGWPNRATVRSGWRRLFVLSLIGLIAFETISIAWSAHQVFGLVQVAHVALWATFAVMISCADWSPVSMTFALLIGLVLHGIAGFVELTVLPMVDIVPQYSGISVVFNGAEHWLRVYGISSHPNVLGGHLAVGVILILGLVILSHGRQRFWLIAAWLMCWLTLLLTFSRSAWLGVTGGGLLALILLLRGRQLTHAWLKSIAVLVTASLGLTAIFVWRFQPFLINRIEVTIVSYETQAIMQRLDAARLALQIFATYPLTGVGLAQSVMVTRDLLGTPIDWIHNVPLLIAAELGVGGIILIGLLLIALVAMGVQRWRRRSISLWQALVGGALIAVAIAMQFDHYVWTVPQGGLLWAWLVGWWLRDDHILLEARVPRALRGEPIDREDAVGELSGVVATSRAHGG